MSHHGDLPKPTNERPRRRLSASSPELVHEITENGRRSRVTWRQVGWHGQSGYFYALEDDIKPHYTEPGSFAPLYVQAHRDEIVDSDTSEQQPSPARLDIMPLPEKTDGTTPFILVLSNIPSSLDAAQLETLRGLGAKVGAAASIAFPFPVEV